MDTKSFTLGAAMHSDLLPRYRDWLLDKQRDLELQDLVWHEILDGDWQSNVDHIRTQLAGYTGRLGIHGPYKGVSIAAYDSAIRAVMVKRLNQGLDFCSEIGATHMVIHSPFQFIGTPMAPNTDDMGQQIMIDYIKATMDEVIPRAEAIGCTLMVETIQDRVPGVLLAVIKAVGSDHLRLSIDTGHVYVNYRKSGGAALDYWVKEAGSLLGHLHIQDTDGHTDRHWVPGDGDINWRTLFLALAETDQNPRLIIEIVDPNQILRAAQWLTELGVAQ